MSKTITVSEADIQALRVAQFTLKTGDPADDRAAADAFQRVLGGLGIERKAEPLASIEQTIEPSRVGPFFVEAAPADGGAQDWRAQNGRWYTAEPSATPTSKPRRGRPRKRAA